MGTRFRFKDPLVAVIVQVDESRSDDQTSAVDHPCRRYCLNKTNRHDAIASDGDISLTSCRTRPIHEDAAPKHDSPCHSIVTLSPSRLD